MLIAVDVAGRSQDLAKALDVIESCMVNRHWALAVTDDATFIKTAELLAGRPTAATCVEICQGSLPELAALARRMAVSYPNGWFISARDLALGSGRTLAGPTRPAAALVKSRDLPAEIPTVPMPAAASLPKARVELATNSSTSVSLADVEVFILNYGYLDRAAKTAAQLRDAGIGRVEILCAECPKDDYAKHALETIVRRPSSDYYSHLWNVAVRRSKAPIFGIITADAELPDAGALASRLIDFFNSAGERGWIYAPDVDYTVWRYQRDKLTPVHRSCYEVPNTDSTCWFMRRACALAIGAVDTSVNKLGYGIDLLGALLCAELGKLCVRDYAVEVIHPPTKNYDDGQAQAQERAWAASLNLSDRFFDHKRRALALVDWARPVLSFCTTTMGRKCHLQLTLPSNLKLAGSADAEFVVLDYGSTDDVETWIRSNFVDEIGAGLLQFHRVDWPTTFHISHAKNSVHRLARGEIVCSVDADSFLLPDYVVKLREHLSPGQTNFLRLKSPDAKAHFSLWGRIALRREHFIRLGGYEELLQGYGYEDSHLIERALLMRLNEVSLHHSLGYCLEHYDVTRTENYGDKSMWGTHDKNVEIGLKAAERGFYANQGRAWGCLDDDPYKLACLGQ